MLKRIGIITSGGDSPGMNPAIRAIVRTGVGLGVEVVGIQNGYQGIFDREFINLGAVEVSGRIRDAGTMLSTSRCLRFKEESAQKDAIEILKKENIQALMVLGGDGSLAGAAALSRHGYRVLGLPCSIDNDIPDTELCIGTDTCLNTVIHLIDMIKAIEVMGRNQGYLALMSAIASGSQVAVIPEFRYDMEKIVENLTRRRLRRHNNSVVVVAEGVCTGQDFMNRLLATAEDRLDQEVRLTVLGHVQRGGSPTFADRYLASRMGEFAMLALNQGEHGSMVGLIRNRMNLTDLQTLSGRRPPLPADAIRLARNLGMEIGVPSET
ncbi:MAG: ATP-dependent 6-phosphofructokinase [Verrucomicrobia bacterium]|nr:ATP-dependent 6-phosphofructokinase [Verrucomicrobiota bacterium]